MLHKINFQRMYKKKVYDIMNTIIIALEIRHTLVFHTIEQFG